MKEKKSKKISLKIFKEHKRIAVILICLLIFSASFAFINYSSYVKNIVQVYYLRSKGFYFSSNRLTPEGKTFQTNPWIISENYNISLNVNSEFNGLKKMTDDIIYNLECSIKENEGREIPLATCSIEGDSLNRVIPGSESNAAIKNVDDINLTISTDISTRNLLTEGTVLHVEVKATSTAPYTQTLQGTFELIVGSYGLLYEIEDEHNRRYIDCIVTNTEKLISHRISLTINEEYKDDIIFDQNNSILDKLSELSGTVIIYDKDSPNPEENGIIKGIDLTLGPKQSVLVRFYKANPSEIYSYRSNSYKDTDKDNKNDNDNNKIEIDTSDAVVVLNILDEEE